MAYPTRNDVQAALEVLQNIVFEDSTAAGIRNLWNALHTVKNGAVLAAPTTYASLALYPKTTLDVVVETGITILTVTDSVDADTTAFLDATGELGVALGRAAVAGDLFKVLGTGDMTNNALATAKGSAVAAEDVFVCLNATSVDYIGSLPS